MTLVTVAIGFGGERMSGATPVCSNQYNVGLFSLDYISESAFNFISVLFVCDMKGSEPNNGLSFMFGIKLHLVTYPL